MAFLYQLWLAGVRDEETNLMVCEDDVAANDRAAEIKESFGFVSTSRLDRIESLDGYRIVLVPETKPQTGIGE